MNTFSEVGGRAGRRDQTRQAVLTAARIEFEAHGFDGANIRAIAARAGVAAGTVIHHHGDKRELLHAALFDDLDAALSAACAALDDSQALEPQLHALATAVFGHYEARPMLSKAMLKESLFAEHPWAARFATQAATVHQAIARVVVGNVVRGALDDSTDPMMMATSWLSFFYFGLISWVQGAIATPVAFVDALTANLVAPHHRSSP